jgi:hypothetical protein
MSGRSSAGLRKRLRDWLWARAESFRERRMNTFVTEFAPTAEMRILDIGGTDLNWRIADQPAHVILLNTSIPDGADAGLLGAEYGDAHATTVLAKNLAYVLGDGKSVPFSDKEFDIGFSNSTIEHVCTFEAQRQFADEVRRVARGIFVQTPARGFFFEPHWLTPFIHWLPKSTQKRLGRNFTLYGWMMRPSSEEVTNLVNELRLLTYREMQSLFPDCEIRRERFLGVTKSFLAIRPVAEGSPERLSPTDEADSQGA